MTGRRVNKRIRLLHEQQGRLTGKPLLEKALDDHHQLGQEITVSFSGGKDSLVATLLILSLHREYPSVVIYNDTTNTIPSSHAYVMDMLDWFEEHYPLTRTRVLTPDTTFGEMRDNIFKHAAEMYYDDSKRWRKKRLKCCRKLKKQPFKRYCTEHPVSVNVCGMRALESSVRYGLFISRGGAYHMKTLNLYRVNPLWDWTAEQVDQFLEHHPLDPPINPIYEQGFGGTGCFMCPIKWLWDKESRETLKKTYPKVYERGKQLLERYREELNHG